MLSGRKTFKSMFGPIGESARFSEKYVLSLDTLRLWLKACALEGVLCTSSFENPWIEIRN